MRVVVVYESMYGNTRQIADAIAKGFASAADVTIEQIGPAEHMRLDDVDLLVVGGPTHARGMSRQSTRKAAAEAALKPKSNVTLEAGTQGHGVREWLELMKQGKGKAAAFDTRIKGPAWIMGSAAKGIARGLTQKGFTLVSEPTSFFVTKDNVLRPDERARATAWGEELAGLLLLDPAATLRPQDS
jgi:flavodoxin